MSAVFLRPQIAKSNMPASLEAVKRMMSLGWVAQERIIGRRVQVHIPPGDAVRVFTRQGQDLPRAIPDEIGERLHQWFGSSSYCNVLDCDWVQADGRLFINDLLAFEGTVLNHLTFPARHSLLFRDFINPKIKVLPIVRSAVLGWNLLDPERPGSCGIVFRSTTTKGWPDSAIINCRSR